MAHLIPLVVASLLLPTAPAGSWPLPHPVLVSGFRPPALTWSAGHRGIDLAARPGDTITAMTSGRVAFAGVVAGKPVVTVALPGPGRRRVTYEPVRARVQVGESVGEGQPIGVVADRGGHCAGRCVHVGLRTDLGYLDPRSLMSRRPAVLKPLGR